MPVYAFKCQSCDTTVDAYRRISERHDAPMHCGKQMRHVITAPMVAADIPEYVSPASGKLIRGRKARAEDFKRTGTRPWEGLEVEKREAAKIRAADDAKFDKSLEREAYHVLNNMDAAKQRVIKGA